MREGFWHSIHEPTLPMPVANERPWSGQEVFLVALADLERRADRRQFRGMSTCRVCNQFNGSAEFSLGGWEWPSGYSHYVSQHNVIPSEAFRRFVESQTMKPVGTR